MERVRTDDSRFENLPDYTIKGAGHFLQEQAPDELADATLKLIADNPV